MKKNNGLTRQGVRDLNHIKGKSVGKVLPEPPNNAGFCKHENLVRDGHQWVKCIDCELSFDATKMPK